MKHFLVLAVALALGMAAFASPPRPDTRPGPIGWEKRITPGFDAPIEYVVVYGCSWVEPELKPADCVAKWGSAAAPVLNKLSNDPDWAPFRDRILSLMALCPEPEAKGALLSSFQKLLAKPNPTPEDQSELVRVFSLIHQADAKQANQLADEGLKNPASPYFRFFVYSLMGRVSQTHDESAKAHLDQILQSLPENDELRKSVEMSLKGDVAVQRANEPMDVVLKKEGKR